MGCTHRGSSAGARPILARAHALDGHAPPFALGLHHHWSLWTLDTSVEHTQPMSRPTSRKQEAAARERDFA
jgi:hypothetical protein